MPMPADSRATAWLVESNICNPTKPVNSEKSSKPEYSRIHTYARFPRNALYCRCTIPFRHLLQSFLVYNQEGFLALRPATNLLQTIVGHQ